MRISVHMQGSTKNRPYDSVVFIQKECAIHVTKRIDSNLRRLTGKQLTNI